MILIFFIDLKNKQGVLQTFDPEHARLSSSAQAESTKSSLIIADANCSSKGNFIDEVHF